MLKRKKTTSTTKVSLSSQSRSLKRMNRSYGRNVLFNCHSRYHGPDRVSREIKIALSDNLHYNEKYNPHPNDYSIDVSSRHGNIGNLFGKSFDVIYLVNCPDDVYIETDEDDMGDWNLDLFQNLDDILNDNGVIITRVAETGIDALLNTYNYLHNTDFSFSGFNEDDEMSPTKLNAMNLKIKKKFLRDIIPIIRRMMKDFLKRNHFRFKLLSRRENEQYIYKEFSNRTDDSIHEFFVLRKISNQPSFTATSPQSVTPSSLRSSTKTNTKTNGGKSPFVSKPSVKKTKTRKTSKKPSQNIKKVTTSTRGGKSQSKKTKSKDVIKKVHVRRNL